MLRGEGAAERKEEERTRKLPREIFHSNISRLLQGRSSLSPSRSSFGARPENFTSHAKEKLIPRAERAPLVRRVASQCDKNTTHDCTRGLFTFIFAVLREPVVLRIPVNSCLPDRNRHDKLIDAIPVFIMIFRFVVLLGRPNRKIQSILFLSTRKSSMKQRKDHVSFF